MKLSSNPAQKHTYRPFTFSILSIALAMAFALIPAPMARAQSQSSGEPSEPQPAGQAYQTLHLANLTQQNEANDIVTDLRNMLPRARIYYVATQQAISIRGGEDDIALAQKILAEIDQPRKAYRLTYTFTETDGSQRADPQRYSLIVVPGKTTLFRRGSKVPIVTGVSKENSNELSQVQYEDIGLHIEADIEGVRLHTKVEQSSLAEERSVLGAQDPVVQQTYLDGMSTLEQGKPMVLGSLDIPGTGRRQQIEVSAEAIP